MKFKSTPHSEKKPYWRYARLIVLLIIMGFLATPHLRDSLETIRKNPALNERHYSFTTTFPFVGSYFLMKPANYNPQTSYPLVISLHGVSDHSYPAEALAQDDIRTKWPTFVIVPLAPDQSFWASSKNENFNMEKGFLHWPDHLPFAVAALKSVSSQYNIDKDRIYIAGHSMGASGVIGAMERYPDIFAAGLASAGSWDPAEISNIRNQLYLFHGANDPVIPASYSINIDKAAQSQKQPVSIAILKDRGHEIGGFIYQNPQMWDGIFSIRKQ